jgi:RND family efflux transporter MFP subunit
MQPTRLILPALTLGAAATACWWFLHRQPEPKTKSDPVRVFPVNATRVAAQDFTVVIESRGTVRPRTQSTLIPEVSGMVVEISPSLREGDFFEAGEVLLRIDPRNYESAVVIALGEVAKARAAVAEEEARAAQAVEDWRRLGRAGEAPDLVARRPYVAETQARLAAAEAAVARARHDVERTRLTAPYAGCVLRKLVDVGQVVTPGTQLAQIYSIDVAEVDLPLTNRDLGFLDLPESYRGEKGSDGDPPGPAVVLRTDYGGREFRWDGTVVRAAGAIDESSRQLYVTVQVKDPYRRKDRDTPPLKSGLFVEAGITGHRLRNVFVLPRSAVRDGSTVLLIDGENRLRKRPITVVWGTRDHVVANDGLRTGDTICLTRLPVAVDGVRVRPTLVDPPAVSPGGEEPLSQGPPAPKKGPA